MDLFAKDLSATTLKDNSLPNILALDPGGTTGWCLFMPGIDQKPDVGQMADDDHHLTLWDLLERTQKASNIGGETLHIVCESFEFRQTERHRDFIDYTPREYIGVVKLFKQMRHPNPQVQLFIQMAGQVKPFFTDDKVKKLGLWVPGRKHAMDATRHYLYHRIFTLKDQSLLMKLR